MINKNGGLIDYPVKMGGAISTWTRYGQIMSERAELKVTASSYASASSQTSSYGGTHWTTSAASSSSTLVATTRYKYWVRWEDGAEELHELPFDARKDQKVAFCFAKRLVSDSNQVPTTLSTKRPMFTAESDIDEKSEVIGVMNLDTGMKYSTGKFFIWNRITEDAVKSQGDGTSIFLTIGAGTVLISLLILGSIGLFFGARAANSNVVLVCTAAISFALATWVMVATHNAQKKEKQRIREFSDDIESIALSSFSEQKFTKSA